MFTILDRERLENMPFDKKFFTEYGEEFCHATGYEVRFAEYPDEWWNEYQDRYGDYHYGR